MTESQRVFIAAILSFIVVTVWMFIVVPKFIVTPSSSAIASKVTDTFSFLNYEDALTESPERLNFQNLRVKGSLNLRGPKFDDIALLDYGTQIDSTECVKVLLPVGMQKAYFVEFGWLQGKEKIPPITAEWEVIKNQPSQILLSWKNNSGLSFFLEFKLNEDYMFEVVQTIVNEAKQAKEINIYSRLNRNDFKPPKGTMILHEGPVGVFQDKLVEISTDKLSSKPLRYDLTATDNERKWVAFSDKYWAVALIPPLGLEGQVEMQTIGNKTQLSFISKSIIIPSGGKVVLQNHLFIGAKKLHLLDKYRDQIRIKLFDRLVDFGILYPITKPILIILQLFKNWLGNFGLAILLFTVLVKIALLPLSIKSYTSMQKMQQLKPQIKHLKELYKADQVKLNKETIALYKKHNTKPLSGCLPMLLQAPILFGLYKVLSVTIEMRHAPFFGWIKDLSAPDPTNIFNLFGFITWELPEFLRVGVWPILLGLTMMLQQRISRNNIFSDEMQQTLGKALPFIFTFIFSTFPAGLVIYWTWSNLLTILQQLIFQSKWLSLSSNVKK